MIMMKIIILLIFILLLFISSGVLTYIFLSGFLPYWALFIVSFINGYCIGDFARYLANKYIFKNK